MKKLVLIPAILMLLASCHRSQSSPNTVDQVLFPPPALKPDEGTSDKVMELSVNEAGGSSDVKGETVSYGYNADANGALIKDTAKKIIKEGDISFETSNIKQTRSAIIAALKKTGGYLAQENESNDGEGGRKEYTLKTRIPAKYFDQLGDVSAAAVKIDSKNISMRDVTTQFIDMATRLQNKKLLEARYLSLLKQANKMGDILEVENKLTEIRSDIESQQGQLNYLSKQVAYSSLDITFYTKHIDPIDKPYGIGDKLISAIVRGWELLQDIFFGLIGLWPLITVAAILLGLFKKWRRRKRQVA